MKKRRTRKRKKAKPVHYPHLYWTNPHRMIRVPVIPKDLKPVVLKKFRMKGKRGTILIAVRLPNDEGYATASVVQQVPTVLREFTTVNVELNSTVPKDIWRRVQMDTAIWYSRWLARHSGAVPSVRKERSKRRKFLKAAIAVYQSHHETKRIMRIVEGKNRPAEPPKPPKKYTFVCIYDPMERIKYANGHSTTFRIHQAGCNMLEKERAKAIRDVKISKYAGDSWILEGESPQAVVDEQIAEFAESNFGYDRSDFTIHECRKEHYESTSSLAPGKKESKDNGPSSKSA